MPVIKAIEYRIKDLVFRLIQMFLRKSDPSVIPVDLTRANRLLFIRHDRIGDMIVSLPVFAAIKKRFPSVTIDVLCSQSNATVVTRDPRIDRVYIYRKRFYTDLATVINLRRQGYDAVVDLINSDSTSGLILTRLCAGGCPRIGVQKKKYSGYYDFAYFHEPANRRHIIRNTLVVLEAFGLNSEKADPYAPVHINERSWQKAERFIHDIKKVVPDCKRLIGLNLSVGQPTRRWATEKYIELTNSIGNGKSGKAVIILFAMAADRPRAERVAAECNAAVFLVPKELSLIEAAAVISQLDVLISPDTALIHIARSFKVLVVGLYPQPQNNFIQWHPFDLSYGAVISRSGNNVFDIAPGEVLARYRELCDSKEVAGE